MEMLILKTNISSKDAFTSVKNNLSDEYLINEVTIDLDDRDKVVRVIGDNLDKEHVLSSINRLGFSCTELPD
jgi:hypothetical protein